MKRKFKQHQFYQYQQNEQSPLILTEPTERKKKLRHMTLEIHILAWDRHKNMVGLTSQWDPNPPLDDNRIFPMAK